LSNAKKKQVLDEMKAMTSVYEVLYHLENSMRQFITRVLREQHGTHWWDMVAPTGLKDTVRKRMEMTTSTAGTKNVARNRSIIWI